jgi:hypothetical protein
MFDDTDECEHEDTAPVVRPWSWMQAAAVTANLFGNVAHSLWAFFDDLKDAAKADVAWGDEKRDAYKSLHRDLEMLPVAEK